MRVGHIELPVRDPIASMAYYVERLGATLVANQGDRFIWIRIGPVEILLKPGRPPPGRSFEESPNVVLYTDALEDRVERLRGRGIELRQEGSCFLFQDPDGHWFQLVDPRGDHGA